MDDLWWFLGIIAVLLLAWIIIGGPQDIQKEDFTQPLLNEEGIEEQNQLHITNPDEDKMR